MLEWRRQRKAAIRTEIARLEKQASRVEQWQQVWGADRTGGLEKVNTDLLTWLDANKGQVRSDTYVNTLHVPYSYVLGDGFIAVQGIFPVATKRTQLPACVTGRMFMELFDAVSSIWH
jgi:hypothetical protein